MSRYRRAHVSVTMAWRNARKRVLPWCMHSRCWQPSMRIRGRRGNRCAFHLWEALKGMCVAGDL